MRKISLALNFVLAFVCAAICSHAITNVPRWVDDVETAYSVERRKYNTLGPQSNEKAEDPLSTPVDLAAMAAELAKLQQTEEKVRDDRRAIALFASMAMVAFFLVFYFTNTHLDEALKDAGKRSTKQEAAEIRL